MDKVVCFFIMPGCDIGVLVIILISDVKEAASGLVIIKASCRVTCLLYGSAVIGQYGVEPGLMPKMNELDDASLYFASE